jgi:dTDP-4-amino-4,6-dideoxy-D-galactose acyltransferase
MEKTIGDAAVLYELEWDTNYFGIRSAKAILYKPLTLEQWKKLKTMFQEYRFVSIYNLNSEPTNAQFIGKDTNAFLADVNIQFCKKLNSECATIENITIHRAMEKNGQVLRIADFPYSKFTEDPGLAALGGAQVYYQWLLNSFGKPDKFFALSKDQKGDVDGYLLYSYSEEACIVELIAVSKDSIADGIGTRLFKAVEYSAFQKGYKEIRVGTQIRNMGAINFYHKIGCKQVGCHQVYHLWNSEGY